MNDQPSEADDCKSIRDIFERGGLSEDDINLVISRVRNFAGIAPISGLQEYWISKQLYQEMFDKAPDITNLSKEELANFRNSPEQAVLVALGARLIEFEESYEAEHGKSPE